MLKRANGRRRTQELNREGLLTEFQWTHASHYCTSVCLAGRHLCVCVCVSVPQQLPGAVEPTFNMLDCPAEQGRLPSSVTSPPDFKKRRFTRSSSVIANLLAQVDGFALFSPLWHDQADANRLRQQFVTYNQYCNFFSLGSTNFWVYKASVFCRLKLNGQTMSVYSCSAHNTWLEKEGRRFSEKERKTRRKVCSTS